MNLIFIFRLIERCELIIQAAIEVETVAFVWQRAKMAGADKLQYYCLGFMGSNFDEVKRSEAFQGLPNESQQELTRACLRR